MVENIVFGTDDSYEQSHSSSSKANCDSSSTALWPHLWKYNDTETMICEHDSWLTKYGTFDVPNETLHLVLRRLAQKPSPILQNSGVSKQPQEWEWVDAIFQEPPSKMRGKCAKVFKCIATIFNAVHSTQVEGLGLDPDRKANDFVYVDMPSTRLFGDDGNKIDFAFVPSAHKSTKHVSNVILPGLYTKNPTARNRYEVRSRILGTALQILTDDPRRMFLYAITIEDDRFTIWYFGRTHSAKSVSFNWFKRPELLIRMFISLSFATETELGLDPHVHKFPDGGSKTEKYYYVYAFPGTPDVATVRYFKTIKSLDERRPYYIAGRTTRVFAVHEIPSLDAHDTSAPDCDNVMVLKDVWLEADRPTETENQAKLFAAVEEFINQNGGWKADKRLKDFTPYMITKLEELFATPRNREEKKYKSLFLTPVTDYKGFMSKTLNPEGWFPDNIFRPPDEDNVSEPIIRSSNMRTTNHSHIDEKEWTGNKDVARQFGHRQQCRFVYKEVCTPLHDIDNLFDATQILAQCLVALQVMFCAGWVHRDISSGNVMAQKGPTGWSVKLGDLEYAKLQDEPNHISSTDPKTGTAAFMAYEILNGKYLIDSMRRRRVKTHLPESTPKEYFCKYFDLDKVPRKIPIPVEIDTSLLPLIPPEGVVPLHDFQHDLESIWWLWLYQITTRTGGEHAKNLAKPIFRFHSGLRMSGERKDTFKEGLDLTLEFGSEMEPVLDSMDDLRKSMYIQYISRALTGGLKNPASFSSIHAEFHKTFANVLGDTSWKDKPDSPGNLKKITNKKGSQSSLYSRNYLPPVDKRKRVDMPEEERNEAERSESPTMSGPLRHKKPRGAIGK